ncbi:class F sortase [Salmonella enterica subsp. enterica serovar Typhimurium]|nr:class F sortase [Salmonella enterica subsp. enterica serovar Typhimurium]
MAVRRATQSPSDDARIPVRVDYPAIGATLSVVSVGVTEDGAMELPDDSSVGGWYRHGSAPGDPEGTAVIASHSGSPRNPVGALYGLRQAAVGDEVTVTDAAGTARRYRVASTQSLGKGELDLSPYFRRDGAAELVLITCGGEWLPDERDYTENIVTIATPVEG